MAVGVRCTEPACKSNPGGQLGEGTILSIGDELVEAGGLVGRVIAELTLRFWPTSLHNPAYAKPSPQQSGSNPSSLQCSNWLRFVNPKTGRPGKRTAKACRTARTSTELSLSRIKSRKIER